MTDFQGVDMRNSTRRAHVVGTRIGTLHPDANYHDDSVTTKTALARECGPVVYAVRLKDGVVKIGFTTNIINRLGSLNCGFGAVLALMPGTLADEKAIHATLVEHRHHGHEYYYPTPAVMAVVNDMRAAFGLSPVAA